MSKLKNYSILIGGLLLMTTPVQATSSSNSLLPAETPPAAGQKPDATIPFSYQPYFGQSMEQPDHIKSLYPDPDVAFTTPGFAPGKENFTTTEEMMSFLHELDAESDRLQLENIGYSQENREIPLLIFTEDGKAIDETKNKPTVWLEAQVHGSEPGAGEAALVAAQKLALEEIGDELLAKINVIIIPRVNPDGSHYFQFGSARGPWINRDHMKLDLPETKAMNKTLQRFKPEVVLTSHEYGHRNWDAFKEFGNEGGGPYHDILLAKGYNLNVPEEIRQTADDLFIQNAFDQLEDAGYSTDTYVSFPEDYDPDTETITVSEGNGSPRFEKEIAALLPSFTFLLEGRGDRFGRESFARRVHSHYLTIESFLQTTAEHSDDISSMIHNAREQLVENGKTVDPSDTIVIRSEATELERPLEILDIETGDVVEVPTTYLSATEAVPTLERVRPRAYLLPPSHQHIADKLRIHGVEVKALNEQVELAVERYEVIEQTIGEQVQEGHITNHVETEIETTTRIFPAGSLVFEMYQTAATVIALALEPESEDSYVTYNFIPVNLGDEVPVYRYMDNDRLDASPISDETSNQPEEASSISLVVLISSIGAVLAGITALFYRRARKTS
ncbi:M14 family zinc carboxypeptidase [Geomicrobium sp. JCM 19055]|uniref:M14 family zinc carboxypeptidase n=1 Tax=Geomicrobium sp. JCM 19055 TaxID=1460649 RepID=UPI00045ED04C|nr:M14 family zinc carboxypeptidase [Geomicrobium sp. JCM 19055]GAJ97762.1 hypothetical protein JCM19055_639 [Geomicrobium sp. JCM 19055]